MSFTAFRDQVSHQFAKMSKSRLFRVDVTGDELWETYLASFRPGDDPIYRERTEHNCSACRSFIKTIGSIVTINDHGEVSSLWDVKTDEMYTPVAEALSRLVKSRAVTGPFLHGERTVGVEKTFEEVTGEAPKRWNHFHVSLPAKYFTHASSIASTVGETRSTYDVLNRALTEIQLDSVDIVLELIDQNSLYLGSTYKELVKSFRNLKASYEAKPESVRALYLWSILGDVSPATARFRNSAIGTLVTEINDGMELEDAVRRFEAMVAPANYKRPTALVSKKMIADAKKTLEQLGYLSSLERRYAVLDDLTINNVLFADRSAKKVMTGDVFDDLIQDVGGKVNPKSFDQVDQVPIDKFLSDILPKAEKLEALFENRHTNKLFSLIAPVDPTAPSMFKWGGNNFSWSYVGDVTDSIKERVKSSGGAIEGDVLIRLAWDNTDDLDLHCYEPKNDHIYYSTRRTLSRNGGMLDVDANGIDGIRPDPVENIVYKNANSMSPGSYDIRVNNFSKRSSSNPGFTMELEINGQVTTIRYDRAVKHHETINVATLLRKPSGEVVIAQSLPSSTSSREVWGLKTQEFHRVSVVMLSPNFWDDQKVGHKHTFFALSDAKSDEPARGFYNEFLGAELSKHRKVLEVLGNKLKAVPADQQLSGIGFSESNRDHLIVRVTGKVSRVLKVVF